MGTWGGGKRGDDVLAVCGFAVGGIRRLSSSRSRLKGPTGGVLEVPGAISQGCARDEARENVLDALRTVLTPDEQVAGQTSSETDLERLRFVAAA